MSATIQQVKTKTVSLKHVMHRAAFVRGFKETQNDIPMDYDAYNHSDFNERWQYERGRLFGLLYKDNLKYNNKVTFDAIRNFSVAVSNRIII